MSPSLYPTTALIRRLSPSLINQIAAGEVVVRPASAVKELIENSLDAGATRIEVAVADDARGFTIRDDGRGMGREDVQLAIERHTTSKIAELDDLARLTTRGFRGEALAAIASVSRLEILTRRAEDQAGTRLKCEGGMGVRVEASAAPPGTIATVRDLFHNTPAREKFLRNHVTEWGAILKEFVRQALARPEVGFAIRWRDRPYLTLPAGQTLRARLEAILPGEAGRGLLEVEATAHEVAARGAIGSPNQARRDRQHQYFFANGRPIVSRRLSYALQEAYRGLLMTQRFPVAAIFIEVGGEEIDVNVHPTKDEVKFRNEAAVAGAIHRAALAALRGADLAPRFEIPPTPGGKFDRRGSQSEAAADRGNETPPQFFKAAPKRSDASDKSDPSDESDKSDKSDMSDKSEAEAPHDFLGAAPPPAANGAPPAAPFGAGAYPDAAAAEESALLRRLAAAPAPPIVLAQIERTYILAEAPGVGLLLVDQHAAHEKILYRRLLARSGGRDVQPLLAPIAYEAGASGVDAIEALIPALAEAGFQVEPFGGGTFVVQSVPAALDGVDVAALLDDLAAELGGADLGRALDDVRARIGARAACRAAVKAGDALSRAEMEALLSEVLQTADALRCPHGRPTMMLLSKEQLDRQFGRMG